MKSNNQDKIKFLKIYASLAEKLNRHPTRADLAKKGISRDTLRHHFVNLDNFKKKAKEQFPKAFDNIVDDSIFTPKALKLLKSSINKNDTYFVSTAIEGCKPHQGFLESINTFNAEREALSLYLTASDPAAAVEFSLDPAFKNEHIVFSDVALNSSVHLSSIKLSAKHIDPTTGLSRLGQRNGSFIYASPKQRLKMTATSNSKLPHAIMTTGAVTLPTYKTNRYMSDRTAHIAENDHVIGGLIVEVVDNKTFHYRQVQADKSGSFIDLGIKYTPSGVEKVRPEALVLGDLHSGETDPIARKAFFDGKDSVLQVTKPKRVFIHDGFNGRSISHHEVKNKVLRAQRSLLNQLDLYTELKEFSKDLEFLASHDFVEEVVVVKSNHDEFLDRYLAEGRYVEDAQNHAVGLKLALAMVEGENPLEHALKWFKIKNADKITWLERDEDYKIAGVELGAHGDKGSNGSRGSLQSMENAYGNSVSGHSHTPEILRGAWQVGTLSLLKLDYNVGASSWVHTSCLLYSNGSRQLINVINGKWKA